MRRLFSPLLLVLLLAGACDAGGSKRCKAVCRRHAECADKRVAAGDESAKYDVDECIAACVNLERDNEGKKIVDRHIECAKNAASCDELAACR
jgi:hypothetical protein